VLLLDDLHAQFRSLLKLTQLVSAINNNGHPTLRLPSARKKIPTTPHDEVILAIATLLVRNHEVVAVGASGAGVLAVQQPIETALSEPDSADNEQPDSADNKQPDSADNEQPDSADNEQPNAPLDFDETLDYRNVAVGRIAAVVNPRTDGDHYTFPDGRCCMLVNKGESLLKTELMGDDVWAHFHAQR
jgi:hypothetical protein